MNGETFMFMDWWTQCCQDGILKLINKLNETSQQTLAEKLTKQSKIYMGNARSMIAKTSLKKEPSDFH